jgi:hypothetical protein
MRVQADFFVKGEDCVACGARIFVTTRVVRGHRAWKAPPRVAGADMRVVIVVGAVRLRVCDEFDISG